MKRKDLKAPEEFVVSRSLRSLQYASRQAPCLRGAQTKVTAQRTRFCEDANLPPGALAGDVPRTAKEPLATRVELLDV